MLEGAMFRLLYCLPLLCFGALVYGADFIPQHVKSISAKHAHWLDQDFERRAKKKKLSEACAKALSDEGRWVMESYFYQPETQIEMGLMLAEGGAIWSKNPFEYHFSFPPEVFAGLGARLFKAYQLPVTYLALNQTEGAEPYRTWELLFDKPDLQEGYRGIEILKVSEGGLSALSQAKAFSNVGRLIVEPTNIDQVIAILSSRNFPKVSRLDLIATTIMAADLKKLFAHPAFTQITEISFTMMNFGDEGMKVLAEASALSHITALSLEIPRQQVCPHRPTSSGFATLLQSPYLSNLKKLAVRSIWELGEEGMKALTDWPGLKMIEYLELQDSLSDVAVARLLRTRALRQLEELRLEQGSYGDEVLDAIADNRDLVSLQRVAVHLHDGISRDAVIAVRTAPHLAETVVSYQFKP